MLRSYSWLVLTLLACIAAAGYLHCKIYHYQEVTAACVAQRSAIADLNCGGPLKPLSAGSTIATTHQRLFEGDLRIPQGPHTPYISAGNEYLLELLSSTDDYDVAELGAASMSYGKTINGAVVDLFAKTSQLQLQFAYVVLFSFLLLFVVACLPRIPELDSGLAHKKAVRELINRSGGCLLRLQDQVIEEAGKKFATAVAAEFASGAENVHVCRFFPDFPRCYKQPAGCGTPCCGGETVLHRLDGKKDRVKLTVTVLTGDYAFLRVTKLKSAREVGDPPIPVVLQTDSTLPAKD